MTGKEAEAGTQPTWHRRVRYSRVGGQEPLGVLDETPVRDAARTGWFAAPTLDARVEEVSNVPVDGDRTRFDRPHDGDTPAW
jgi:hypothetical protein